MFFIVDIILFIIIVLSIVYFSIRSNKKHQSVSIKAMHDQFLQSLQKYTAVAEKKLKESESNIESSERNVTNTLKKMAEEREFIQENIRQIQEYREKVDTLHKQQSELQDTYHTIQLSIQQFKELEKESKDILTDFDWRKEEFEKKKVEASSTLDELTETLDQSRTLVESDMLKVKNVLSNFEKSIEETTSKKLKHFDEELENRFTQQSQYMLTELSNHIVTMFSSNKKHYEQQIKMVEEKVQTLKDTVQGEISQFNVLSEGKKKELLEAVKSTSSFIHKALQATSEQQQQDIEQHYKDWNSHYTKKIDMLYSDMNNTVAQRQHNLEQHYKQWDSAYGKKFDDLHANLHNVFVQKQKELDNNIQEWETKFESLHTVCATFEKTIVTMKQKNTIEMEQVAKNLNGISQHVHKEVHSFSQDFNQAKEELAQLQDTCKNLVSNIDSTFELEMEQRMSIVKQLWESHRLTLEENHNLSLNDFNAYVSLLKKEITQHSEEGIKAFDTVKDQARTNIDTKLQELMQEFEAMQDKKQMILLSFDETAQQFNKEKENHIVAMHEELETSKTNSMSKLTSLDDSCNIVLIGFQSSVEHLQKEHRNSLHDFKQDLGMLKEKEQQFLDTLFENYSAMYTSFQEEQEEKQMIFKQNVPLFFQKIEQEQKKAEEEIYAEYQKSLSKYKDEHMQAYQSMIQVFQKQLDSMIEDIQKNHGTQVNSTIEKYDAKNKETEQIYETAMAEYKDQLEEFKIHLESEHENYINEFKNDISVMKQNAREKLLDYQSKIELLEGSHREILERNTSELHVLDGKYQQSIGEHQEHVKRLQAAVSELKVQNNADFDNMQSNFEKIIASYQDMFDNTLESYQEKMHDLLRSHEKILGDKQDDFAVLIKDHESNYTVLRENFEKKLAEQIARLTVFKEQHNEKVNVYLNDCKAMRDTSKQKLLNAEKELEEIQQNHMHTLKAIEEKYVAESLSFEKHIHSLRAEKDKLVSKNDVVIQQCTQAQQSLQKQYEKHLEDAISSVKMSTQQNIEGNINHLTIDLEKQLQETKEHFDKRFQDLKKNDTEYQKTSKQMFKKFSDAIKILEQDIKKKKHALQQSIKEIKDEHSKYQDLITKDWQQQEMIKVSQASMEEKIEYLDEQAKKVQIKANFTDELTQKVERLETKTKTVTQNIQLIDQSVLRLNGLKNSFGIFEDTLQKKSNEHKQLLEKLEHQNKKIVEIEKQAYDIQELQGTVIHSTYNIEDRNNLLQDKLKHLNDLVEQVQYLDSAVLVLKNQVNSVNDDVAQVETKYHDIQNIKEIVTEAKKLAPTIDTHSKTARMNREKVVNDVTALKATHDTLQKTLAEIKKLEPTIKEIELVSGVNLRKSDRFISDMPEKEKIELIKELHRKGYSDERNASMTKTSVEEVRLILDNAFL